MLNPIMIGLTVAILACSVAAFWILFEAAGIPGWNALIPVYNDSKWMGAVWNKGAFIRRMVSWAALICSVAGLVGMGAITVNAETGSFSVASPFTLNQSLVGLVACVSLIWVVCMQIEANWYAADAFDGTLGTFFGLTFLGGFAYLWMAWLVKKGDRRYLGTLDERIEAEEAERISYARV